MKQISPTCNEDGQAILYRCCAAISRFSKAKAQVLASFAVCRSVFPRTGGILCTMHGIACYTSRASGSDYPRDQGTSALSENDGTVESHHRMPVIADLGCLRRLEGFCGDWRHAPGTALDHGLCTPAASRHVAAHLGPTPEGFHFDDSKTRVPGTSLVLCVVHPFDLVCQMS